MGFEPLFSSSIIHATIIFSKIAGRSWVVTSMRLLPTVLMFLMVAACHWNANVAKKTQPVPPPPPPPNTPPRSSATKEGPEGAIQLSGYKLLSNEELSFDFGKTTLKKSERLKLDEAIQKLDTSNKEFVITVAGYEDNVGAATFTGELGPKRAAAVVDYLATEQKIPFESIRLMGLGSTPPVPTDETSEGRSANRRVAVRFYQLPDNNVVRVYYATDRQQEAGQAVSFGGGRDSDGTLQYGMVDVSIPREHRMGYVERPSAWKFEFTEDPNKHLVLKGSAKLSVNEFFANAAAQVALSPKKDAFVFIHGYNTPFQDAVFRTAQLAYDLQFRGAPILYSLPSGGPCSAISPTRTTSNGALHI